MIDIHAHILPGIDDGAADWDESYEMARIALRDGVHTIVATPHMMWDGAYSNRAQTVLALVDEANDRFASEGIDLKILPGGEIYLSQETPAALDRGDYLTYNNQSKYILVEWSTAETPHFVEQILFECSVRKLTPVIAHPERNARLSRDPDLLAQWVEQGMLLQVNARSLLGDSGEQVRRAAEELLARRLVHFIASDAHSIARRPPGLMAARERVEELQGKEIADILTVENPRRLMTSEQVIVWDPVIPKSRGGLLARLFRRTQ